MDDIERLNELCSLAAIERDSKKLIALGCEINKLLQGKQLKVIFEPTAVQTMSKKQAA